jgi:hypothetical protein
MMPGLLPGCFSTIGLMMSSQASASIAASGPDTHQNSH